MLMMRSEHSLLRRSEMTSCQTLLTRWNKTPSRREEKHFQCDQTKPLEFVVGDENSPHNNICISGRVRVIVYGGRTRGKCAERKSHMRGWIELTSVRGKENNRCQGHGRFKRELCMEAGKYPDNSCQTRRPASFTE